MAAIPRCNFHLSTPAIAYTKYFKVDNPLTVAKWSLLIKIAPSLSKILLKTNGDAGINRTSLESPTYDTLTVTYEPGLTPR